ncbi:MAG: OmpH family outer membrane protein [Rhodoferax sp.]|nr:OmpH family outer membrane protein [Rhodoferax sp.]
MKTLKTMWASGLLCMFLATAVHAQESRLAFINSQRITSESGPAKAATAKLEPEFSKRQKDLTDLQASLKSFSEKFERDAPTMTESQRAAKQKEFVEQNRDFQRKKREFDEDLNGRRNEELQQVYEKATKAIKQLAETEKYDLVVQEAVYFNPKIDITDKVIKILNAGAK